MYLSRLTALWLVAALVVPTSFARTAQEAADFRQSLRPATWDSLSDSLSSCNLSDAQQRYALELYKEYQAAAAEVAAQFEVSVGEKMWPDVSADATVSTLLDFRARIGRIGQANVQRAITADQQFFDELSAGLTIEQQDDLAIARTRRQRQMLMPFAGFMELTGPPLIDLSRLSVPASRDPEAASGILREYEHALTTLMQRMYAAAGEWDVAMFREMVRTYGDIPLGELPPDATDLAWGTAADEPYRVARDIDALNARTLSMLTSVVGPIAGMYVELQYWAAARPGLRWAAERFRKLMISWKQCLKALGRIIVRHCTRSPMN